VPTTARCGEEKEARARINQGGNKRRKKPEPAGRPNGSGLGASSRYRRLEVQLEVKYVVNSISSVNQANVIADYDVPISRRRGAKANEQITWDGPNSSAHIRRKNKSFMNIRLPFAVPIAALAIVESVVVMLVPIAGALAIVVVEPIVIVMVAIVVPVVISLIVIMMVAIIMILSVSERYT
jgi:hypothetical protein